MPPRTTRASKAKGGSGDDTETTTATSRTYTLEAETDNPPRLFVLPKKATADARIVTLPHPRYSSKSTRFLVCPETGAYEFTQISSPKSTPRSWLITGEDGVTGEKKEDEKSTTEVEGEGTTSKSPTTFSTQTTQDADLFVATAVDPLFLVLPALVAEPCFTSGSDSPPRPLRSRSRSPSSPDRHQTAKRMFLTADDHFDALRHDGGSHLSQLLRYQPAVRTLFTKRMAVVCDTVAAADETMYRLNEDKVLLALLGKAQRTSQHLPASLEEKFVTRALEAPVQSLKSTAGLSAAATAAAASTNGASTPLSTAGSVDSGAESQASTSTTASLVSEASTLSTASTAATSVAGGESEDDLVARAAMQAPEEVVALQRLRVAFQFICSRYVPPALTATLTKKLQGSASASGIDFTPLNAYLAKLAQMRQATALARSAALDYAGGRKRGLEDEEDDDRAEKRRKQLEEEKRKKAGESRGVKNLKKVNVTGMKKLSEFFKKK
ncbi:hypothetical protein SPBR_07185 [Sporothrix brasiliensis 5110]|uniref:Ribonuclease H2 subunit B n=1 Tax=Sporothrix brasiliensis 5110 TaxID=1398154 RepID=A0A0C2IRC1_9PEZI|nr:uncharacterized protein SPBR_07185 [Sporothrix brasiliensis 5110]KIH89435.1 hypothetical protein SPBR_07185 [Sporothrix brasiliensis 5110]